MSAIQKRQKRRANEVLLKVGQLLDHADFCRGRQARGLWLETVDEALVEAVDDLKRNRPEGFALAKAADEECKKLKRPGTRSRTPTSTSRPRSSSSPSPKSNAVSPSSPERTSVATQRSGGPGTNPSSRPRSPRSTCPRPAGAPTTTRRRGRGTGWFGVLFLLILGKKSGLGTGSSLERNCAGRRAASLGQAPGGEEREPATQRADQ